MKIDKKKGWFKLYRDLYDSHVWLKSSPEHCKVLMTLMGMVNHTENEWEFKGKTYRCQPGQTITSVDSIVAKCGKGISTQNVRTALKRFAKLKFLTIETSTENTLITISKWVDYQKSKLTDESEPNKRSTNGSQTTNKRLTTNKNEKNDAINLKKMLNQNKKL